MVFLFKYHHKNIYVYTGRQYEKKEHDYSKAVMLHICY